MLVAKQLSDEIDKMLPKAQGELAEAMETLGTISRLVPDGTELTQISLSVGDIDLLIRREKGILKRYA